MVGQLSDGGGSAQPDSSHALANIQECEAPLGGESEGVAHSHAAGVRRCGRANCGLSAMQTMGDGLECGTADRVYTVQQQNELSADAEVVMRMRWTR